MEYLNCDHMEKGIKAYHLYLNLCNTEEVLPETVREDLNMDDLCEQVDYTSSCIGRQYLYHILCMDKVSDVAKHEQFIEKLQTDHPLRNQLVNALQKLNKPDAYSIVDILAEKEHTYSRGYLLVIQVCRWLPAFFLILMFRFSSSPIPFILLLVSYIFNGYLHFKQKNILSCYFFSMPQLYKLLKTVNYLTTIPSFLSINDKMESTTRHLKELCRKLGSFRYGIALESESAMIVYLLTELINIFTLYSTINIVTSFQSIQKRKGEIEQVFCYVGFLDMLCSISFLREKLPYYCKPSSDKEGERLKADSIYHPLIKDCVSNYVSLSYKSMLITGSNMSGKTSFIRTVAINLLTAKALNTCFAKEFCIDIHRRLYSVIHTEDDLVEGKSYFFKEAENVKVALEKGKEGNYLLIFDELFKGTNTMERIAINSAVFSDLAKANNLIFASTHDLELTTLLNDQYELYHFSEKVTDDRLLFDYKLKKGIAKEGNAIKILELCGYPPELVQSAKDILPMIR